MNTVEKISVDDLSQDQITYYVNMAFGYHVVSAKIHGRTGPNGEALFRGEIGDRYRGRYDSPLESFVLSAEHMGETIRSGHYDIEFLHDEAGTWEITSQPVGEVNPDNKVFVTQNTDMIAGLNRALIKHTYGEMVDDA